MSFSAFHTAYLVYMYVLTTPSNVESVDTWPSLHGLVRTHSTLHHYKVCNHVYSKDVFLTVCYVFPDLEQFVVILVTSNSTGVPNLIR